MGNEIGAGDSELLILLGHPGTGSPTWVFLK